MWFDITIQKIKKLSSYFIVDKKSAIYFEYIEDFNHIKTLTVHTVYIKYSHDWPI